MATTTPSMAVEELLGLPSDGSRRELHAGELITMAPAGLDHGGYSFEIALRIGQFVREHRLGRVVGTDVGFLLQEHPDTLFAPDVAFIRAERLPFIQKRSGYCIGPPDLAVEVVSPNDRIKAVHAKAEKYLEFGTVEVWVVNPRQRSIVIFAKGQDPVTLNEHDVMQDRSLLLGFHCLVSDLIGKEF